MNFKNLFYMAKLPPRKFLQIQVYFKRFIENRNKRYIYFSAYLLNGFLTVNSWKIQCYHKGGTQSRTNKPWWAFGLAGGVS